MKLIITDTNWADEMDIWGFEVMEEKEYLVGVDLVKMALTFEDELTVYIGTNEELFFDSNFESEFEVKDITEDDMRSVKRIFGSLGRGHTVFEQLVETAGYVVSDNDPDMYKKITGMDA